MYQRIKAFLRGVFGQVYPTRDAPSPTDHVDQHKTVQEHLRFDHAVDQLHNALIDELNRLHRTLGLGPVGQGAYHCLRDKIAYCEELADHINQRRDEVKNGGHMELINRHNTVVTSVGMPEFIVAPHDEEDSA